MMNRGEMKTYIAEILGMTQPDGTFLFDTTTVPTNNRINFYIDDRIRYITSLYGFRFTEKLCSYPFYHTVPTQSLSAVGFTSNGTSITGTITPYPPDLLQIGCSAPLPYLAAANYSGISFTGVDASGTSMSGTTSFGTLINTTYSGIGYTYDLGNTVEKIVAITVPHIAQKLQYVTQYDMDKYYPLGNASTTGTCAYYIEVPGMTPSGNKAVQFYPFPPSDFTDKKFTLHYMKEHVNMTSDTSVQDIIPTQFEQIIIDAVLEKCYEQLSDPQSAIMYAKKVRDRGLEMRSWAERNYDTARRWIDGDVGGSFQPTTSVNTSVAGMLGLI